MTDDTRRPRPALKRALLAASVAAALFAVACASAGSDAEPAGSTAPSPAAATRAASVIPAAADTPESPKSPESEEDRQARFRLDALYTQQEGVEITAVRQAADTGNTGFIAPIVDLARFGFADDERNAIADALTRLTGQEFNATGFDLYEKAYMWLGRHPEVTAVPGYDRWKGEVYGAIDRRFIDFFYEGVPASVPISGVQWGGVGVDGIPPLDNPKFVSAEKATYLELDEPVFGVSINGDARAYPLRILAWHELSNDVVGGKPVALVY